MIEVDATHIVLALTALLGTLFAGYRDLYNRLKACEDKHNACKESHDKNVSRIEALEAKRPRQRRTVKR